MAKEVVATSLRYREPPRGERNLEERLIVRFPRVWRELNAAGFRWLRPRSRARRASARRNFVSGWAAASRRDFELMLVRYSPEVEFNFAPDFQALGLGETYRGHGGMYKLLDAFFSAWEQVQIHPVVLLDMGERFLGFAHLRLISATTGLEFEREFAQLITIEKGLVVREQEFFSWDDGLHAAGLDAEALPLPFREMTTAQAAEPRA